MHDDATVIDTSAAPPPGGAYSQAVVVGRTVYTAGAVGLDPETSQLREGVEDQVRQAIDNLEAVLRAAGAELRDVVKTNCFLADIGDFHAFNQIYQQRFSPPYPARSTVGVSLAGEILFEIEAVATLALCEG
jgi:2-iminobutanoate/2-iminopropanoate deaminase